MKLIKYVLGILLATFGVIVTLTVMYGLSQPKREIDLKPWAWGVLWLVLGGLPVGIAVLLLRRRVDEIPPRRCPKCGSKELVNAVSLVSPRKAWLAHTGGWLLAALWGASRPQAVRCFACDTGYSTETRGTRIVGILMWILITIIVFSSVVAYFRPDV